MNRDNELCELYVLGVPVPALARRFGVTEWRVTHIAGARGLRTRGKSREDAKRRIRLNRIRANIEAMPSNKGFWDE